MSESRGFGGYDSWTQGPNRRNQTLWDFMLFQKEETVSVCRKSRADGGRICRILPHSFMKFFGRCNDLDREMRQCLKKEYQENRAKSQAHAEAMRQKLMTPPKHQ